MVDETNAAEEVASFPRYPGWCSFCRKNYKDVGPLAEGPDQVYICFQCCLLCANIIHAECQRRRTDTAKPK
jgi:ATP-dependent Clp protease ATP-binding subunit ClpX